MGLQTSKAGSLAYPLPKTYQGNLVGYSPAYAGPLGAQSAGDYLFVRSTRAPSPRLNQDGQLHHYSPTVTTLP